VILLDWKEPQLWLRQLLDWVLFLRSVMEKLDLECWQAMEKVMSSWKGRRGEDRTMGDSGGGANGPRSDDVALGPGEWEDALGLPLCVVCQNVSGGPVPL
jgi:dynein light intermediate chain 1